MYNWAYLGSYENGIEKYIISLILHYYRRLLVSSSVIKFMSLMKDIKSA